MSSFPYGQQAELESINRHAARTNPSRPIPPGKYQCPHRAEPCCAPVSTWHGYWTLLGHPAGTWHAQRDADVRGRSVAASAPRAAWRAASVAGSSRMWEFPGWKPCFWFKRTKAGSCGEAFPGGWGWQPCPRRGRALRQEAVFLLQPRIRRVGNVPPVSGQPGEGKAVGDLRAAASAWRGGRKDGENIFSRACCDRTRSNGFKLREGRFRLDRWKKFFAMRVVKPWPWLLREAVGPRPWNQAGRGSGHPDPGEGVPARCGGWAGWPLEVPSHPEHSVIPFYDSPPSPPHLLPPVSILMEDRSMGREIPLHCICLSLRSTQLDCLGKPSAMQCWRPGRGTGLQEPQNLAKGIASRREYLAKVE